MPCDQTPLPTSPDRKSGYATLNSGPYFTNLSTWSEVHGAGAYRAYPNQLLLVLQRKKNGWHTKRQVPSPLSSMQKVISSLHFPISVVDHPGQMLYVARGEFWTIPTHYVPLQSSQPSSSSWKWSTRAPPLPSTHQGLHIYSSHSYPHCIVLQYIEDSLITLAFSSVLFMTPS